jgi:nitrilase
MRIAAAQARPFWLDPSATTKKVIAWLENAAAQQVELIAFPETFLSGYPSWLEHTGGARFDDAMQKRAYAAYLDAAVEVTGPESCSGRTVTSPVPQGRSQAPPGGIA